MAFGVCDQPVENLSQLRGTRADPVAMVQKGLFGTMPQHAYEPSNLIKDYELLRTLRLEDVLFNVRTYQNQDRDQFQFIQEIENYLLLVNQINPNRVSVKLVPNSPEGLLDHRYFKFYEYLADQGVSGIFSITGANSLYDIHLGRWNAKAITSGDGTEMLMPQHEKSIMPAPPAPDIKTVRVTSRSAVEGVFGWTGNLDLQVDGKTVTIERKPSGTVWFGGKGGHRVALPSTQATQDLVDNLLNRSQTPIHTDIKIDFNLLDSSPPGPFFVDRTMAGLRELSEKQREVTLKFPDSELIDTQATSTYHDIVYKIGTGGAVNIKRLAEQVRSIALQLTEEQVDYISLACISYYASALERGQLGDLEDLDQMFNVRGAPMPMDAALADRIRLYADNLPPGVITKVLKSIDRDGYVTPDVHQLTLQSDSDQVDVQDPMLRAAFPIRRASTVDYLDDLGRPKHPADFQTELTARLINYVQEQVPGIEVTPEVIYEIKRYGEIIQVAQGKSDFLERMQSATAIGIARTLEYNLGTELTGLRKALPAGTLKEYLALPPVSELDKPRLVLAAPQKPEPVQAPKNEPSDAEISSHFYDAADAYDDGDFQFARFHVNALFERAESGQLGVPQAAHFLRIRLDVIQGELTEENILEKSALTEQIIQEIRQAISARSLNENDEIRSVCYEIFKLHGFGGYMVAALALIPAEPR
jgi:hypothetical protein